MPKEVLGGRHLQTWRKHIIHQSRPRGLTFEVFYPQGTYHTRHDCGNQTGAAELIEPIPWPARIRTDKRAPSTRKSPDKSALRLPGILLRSKSTRSGRTVSNRHVRLRPVLACTDSYAGASGPGQGERARPVPPDSQFWGRCTWRRSIRTRPSFFCKAAM